MKILLLSVLLVLTSCATTPLLKHTMSGNPEAIFESVDKEEIKEKIVNMCLSRGAIVEGDSDSRVICTKTMVGSKASMYKALVGNSRSSDPEYKSQFNIVKLKSNVKVVVFSWVEMYNSYGSVDKNYIKDNRNRNDVQQLLFNLGGK